MRIVFSGGGVITSARSELRRGTVVVDDGTITSVSAGQAPASLLSTADEVVDTTDRLVMPGFINAHDHLFQSMLRGLSTNRSLESWLEHDIWPAIPLLTPDDMELAALNGLAENLRSGVTAVLENHYVQTDTRNVDRVAAAFERIGIRGRVARGGVDVNLIGDREDSTESATDYLRNTRAFRDIWEGAADGRITTEAAIQTTWLASPELADGVAAYMEETGSGLHAHCAETRASVAFTRERYGVTEVGFFARHGLLGPSTQLVHCVWLSPSERTELARTGTVVVSCPVSNAYLASGPAPVAELLADGVSVALGCDGAASNNAQNMFEVVKWTVLSDRLRTLDATRLTEADALSMAWDGGAAALGRAGELGRVEVGYRADLVTLDIRRGALAGSAGLRKAVVFGGSPDDVDGVWVDGRQIVRHGAVTTVDEHEIGRSVAARMDELGLVDPEPHGALASPPSIPIGGTR